MSNSRSAYDVIVVGVGAMGSSTCYHLARRGAAVLGLEQFAIPHDFGSSHGHSRMIRMAYYEHPDYVPLLRRAYELWERFEANHGTKLLHETGGLYLGPAESELVGGSLRAAREHGLPHELLSRDDIRRRFGQFTAPEDWVGLYETRAGFLRPEHVICAHADAALRAGAELHGHEPVREWSASDAGVTVRTDCGTYQGKTVIFCGGAWTDRLVRDLGVPLVVTRQVLGWTWPRRPERFRLGEFPVWAIGNPDGSLYYGFPMLPDSPGFKSGHHAPGPVADPDRVNRNPMPEDEHPFRNALQQYLPDADGPTLAMRICLYTNSPDHHFILDRHPRHQNVLLACGFSGHGFKFASVVGEIMTDLALDDATKLPIGFLGLARFQPP